MTLLSLLVTLPFALTFIVTHGSVALVGLLVGRCLCCALDGRLGTLWWSSLGTILSRCIRGRVGCVVIVLDCRSLWGRCLWVGLCFRSTGLLWIMCWNLVLLLDSLSFCFFVLYPIVLGFSTGTSINSFLIQRQTHFYPKSHLYYARSIYSHHCSLASFTSGSSKHF